MQVKISQKDLNTWADYLLNYSLDGIAPQDVVMIKGEHVCWPLISILQDKIFQAGAIADVYLVTPDNDRGRVWGSSIAKNGTVKQIERVPDWQMERYNNMSKYIEILGAENPKLFEGLPEVNAIAIMRAEEPYKNIRLGKPWVLTLFPTQGFADLEGMTLEEYASVIVSASTVDPKMLEKVEEEIYQLMSVSNSFTIVTEHPHTGNELVLQMDISKRNIIKCTGKRNFPDGEVFTSPNANSVDGEIYVDLPVFQGGSTIQGIYLKFVSGKIVEYSAKIGQDALMKIIETDEGSHRLGEVALGMNNGIQKALKHPLFVEKVGGTVHIAIGASYPECFTEDPNSIEGKSETEALVKEGIMNKSAQHVDIVTDFRPGGVGRGIFLDNTELKIKNNIWVIK